MKASVLFIFFLSILKHLGCLIKQKLLNRHLPVQLELLLQSGFHMQILLQVHKKILDEKTKMPVKCLKCALKTYTGLMWIHYLHIKCYSHTHRVRSRIIGITSHSH